MRFKRPGISLVYASVAMIVMVGVTSLSVDFGRVQLVKAELRLAAEAAARAGAAQLAVSPASAISTARQYAALNKADRSSVVLDTTADIELGKWDAATRTFIKLSPNGYTQANAVRVIARRTKARGNAVPLMFAQLIGRPSLDVAQDAVAMVVPKIEVDQEVLATANPYLAGMPKGTIASVNNPHDSPDYAGNAANPVQSPIAVTMRLTEGAKLTFDSIDGVAAHDPNLASFSPDGELADIGRNTAGSENGISNMNAPINALVALFLGDDKPSLNTAPAALDFGTQQARDYTIISPKLQQIFFIGDGRTTSGATQETIVPKGATRLYVATWDFYEWNNNHGYRTVKVSRPQQIITVK